MLPYIKFNILNYIQEIFFFFFIEKIRRIEKKKKSVENYEFKIIFFY